MSIRQTSESGAIDRIGLATACWIRFVAVLYKLVLMQNAVLPCQWYGLCLLPWGDWLVEAVPFAHSRHMYHLLTRLARSGIVCTYHTL